MRPWKLLVCIFFAGVFLIFLVYFAAEFNQETAVLSDETRAQAPGEFMTFPEGMTHFIRQGSDSSGLIVFIHGGGITGLEVWGSTIPFFAKNGYQILAYDLYGRGYSDRPRVDYTPELLGLQLSRLLDSLNIEGPFNIVTMSMGAMIALDYTARHPDKVKKIILIDPAATGDFRANVLLKIPLINSLLMTAYWYPNAVENQRKEFVDQELFSRYRDRLIYFMNFSGYKYVNYSTWMHTLGQSKVHLLDSIKPGKVLLHYGTHDPYFPPGNIDVYTRHYPSLQHKAIQNAGHMPQLEKPAEVNTIIYSFFSN